MVALASPKRAQKLKKVLLISWLVYSPYFHLINPGFTGVDFGNVRIVTFMFSFRSLTLSVAKRLRATAASCHETSGKASAFWGSLLCVFIVVTFFLRRPGAQRFSPWRGLRRVSE